MSFTASSLAPFASSLPSSPPSSYTNHHGSSTFSYSSHITYTSLLSPSFGFSYTLNEIPTNGPYIQHVHTRTPNPTPAPAPDTATTLSEMMTATLHESFSSTFTNTLTIVTDSMITDQSPPIPEPKDFDEMTCFFVSLDLAVLQPLVTSILTKTTASTTAALTSNPITLDDEVRPVSKYAAELPFVDNGVKVTANPSSWTCEQFPKEYENGGRDGNLWMNLSDGFIGGGRKQWDGSGGTGGGLKHYEETGGKYPLSVKLGTISADLKNVDVFCYANDEDGMVTVPNLAELLQRRGLMVGNMSRTSKTMAELELEKNKELDFSAITEGGAKLIEVHAPTLLGLKNLGNSCYLNSSLQLLQQIPALRAKFPPALIAAAAAASPPSDPSNDAVLQMSKLFAALSSKVDPSRECSPEKAATLTEPTPTPADPNDPIFAIEPYSFRGCIGKGHTDFSTGEQQCAAEYLRHLLDRLSRSELQHGLPPTADMFRFEVEKRTACSIDGAVKYSVQPGDTVLTLNNLPMDKAVWPEPTAKKMKSGEEEEPPAPIPRLGIDAILDNFVAPTAIEDMEWEHIGMRAEGAATLGMKNFPEYLMIQVNKVEVDEATWSLKKLKVDVAMPETLDLTKYRAAKVPGETLAPHAPAATPAAAPAIDEAAVAQLTSMGFGENGCKRAILATGGDVEAASNWIFEHMGDADFNDPPAAAAAPAASSSSSATVADEAAVQELVANLGMFTADQVRPVLAHCSNASDRAADWLFSHMDSLDADIAALAFPLDAAASASEGPAPQASLSDGEGVYSLQGFISHIGANTSSGHYVCHVKVASQFVIMNDDKIGLSQKPPLEKGFVYLYKRID